MHRVVLPTKGVSQSQPTVVAPDSKIRSTAAWFPLHPVHIRGGGLAKDWENGKSNKLFQPIDFIHQ